MNGILLAALLAAQPVTADTTISTSIEILDIENRGIVYHVDRPDVDAAVPILLVVDGSGCRGQRRRGFGSLYQPQQGDAFARVAVEKAGIDPMATDARDCPAEYRARHSIDNWLADHLRVLQHLRGTASWWDGRLFVFGWSDGGDLAARLTASYPNVDRALLGAMGGGYPMHVLWSEFWDCHPDRTDDVESCKADLSAHNEEVRQKPLASLGKQDSNMLIRSRDFADLGTLLAYDHTPIMIVHGALDYDHMPVQSARLLVARLGAAGRENVSYCEVPDMGHGQGSFAPERGARFEKAMLGWLLEGTFAAMTGWCDQDPDLTDIHPPATL